MNKYPKYKSSGVEWIGEIPEHWSSPSLKRYSIIKRGSSPRPIDDPKYFSDDGIYSWVRISDVTKSERYLFETEEKLSELGSSLSTKIELNDLFLSIAGSVGKPIITKIQCCIHDGFVWFQNLLINKEFLFYTFKIGQCFSGLGKMGTQLNLNTDTIGMIKLPLPSFTEQLQIVQFLDEKTGVIDKLISTKERKIELLKQQRTSLINEVITKGLNPKVKMKDSGVEWIGEIPEHWEVSRFKYVSEIVTGNTPSKMDGGEYYTEDDGFLWIKPTYLKGDKYVDDSDEKLTELGRQQTRVIPKESIMICCIGNTIGKYGMSNQDVSTNQQINSVIPYQSMIKSWYCLYFVDVFTRDLLNRSNFVTLPILTKSDLENIEVIVPPIKEQEQIVEHIESNTKEIDELVSMEQNKIDLLKEYRQSLISEVITGKIDVRTNPN